MLAPMPDVATPSDEVQEMAADLELIADVRAGLRRMRQKAWRYLPKYEAEDAAEWQRRVGASVWRGEFVDALTTLASKPFSKPITLPEDTPAPVLRFTNDVDAAGNDVTTFARRFFTNAVADGVVLLLIDMPAAPGESVRTVADSKRLGLRPYWASYAAASVIDCRTKLIAGRREIVHLRLRENIAEPSGDWGEQKVEQIRVLVPGAYSIWRRPSAADAWAEVEHGPMFTTSSGGVPAVLMFTGERLGDFQARPPLVDLANMQVELFRALSRQEEVLIYSASPMLCAKGVSDIGLGIKVGPKRLLLAGENGDWSYVQPDARVLKEIREQAASIIVDMQRLGLQPALSRNGPLTATEVALASSKASTVLESWAIGLRDCLQTALAITIEQFLYDDKKAVGAWVPTINVHCDFSSDLAVNAETKLIVDAAKIGLLSQDVARAELLRRGLIQSVPEETGAAAV